MKTWPYKRSFDEIVQRLEDPEEGLWLTGNSEWAKVFPSVCGAVDPLYSADMSGNADFRSSREWAVWCRSHDRHTQSFRKNHCGNQ
jgi:hypothetical protein